MMLSLPFFELLWYLTLCLLPALAAAIFGSGRSKQAAASCSLYALAVPPLVLMAAIMNYSDTNSFWWSALGVIMKNLIETGLILSIPGWLCVYPAIRDRRKGDELS